MHHLQRHIIALLAVIISASSLYSATSWAQLEEVVVTAERREQNLQLVPVAVTAFTSNQLIELQITETYDLLRRIPNLTGANNVGQSSNVSYFMRGVGNDESLLSFDPPIQSYIDDVLRGPQG